MLDAKGIDLSISPPMSKATILGEITYVLHIDTSFRDNATSFPSLATSLET